MANTSPLQTRDPHVKTPVVVVLVDSNAVPPSQSSNDIPYIYHLLDRLDEANQRRPIYLGLVRYNPVHYPPLSIISITLASARSEPMKVPASQAMSGFSSGVAAFDGYVFAMKLFDNFQSQRTPEQHPVEEFSYHLWHFAAGENERANGEHSAHLYWGWEWKNVPAELQKRNIKLSVVLLKPCPRFSDLFSAVSPESVEPWFPTCPHHEFLLSGFDAHGHNSDVVPPTVPAKRPADTHAEYRSQRLKMEDASQAIKGSPSAIANPPATPCHPPMPYTAPTVPQVMTQGSTIQSPVREAQRITDDQPVWLGKLIWSCGGSEVDAPVQATNPIRDLRMSMWPTALRLDIIEAGMSCLGFQALVHKNKAPVVRVQCQPGMDNHDFGELVKTLRKSKCVAVASARWETESQDKGSQELGLVLAPLSSGLFCAILPASELPRAVLRHPQQAKQETKVPADCSPPTDIPRENVELLQGEDPCSHQTNDFTAASADALVQLISQQQQQAYVQAQLQQLQAQNIEQHASLDAQLALGDELTGITCGNEPIVATENCAGADFGLIGPHLEQWYHDENLFTSYTQL